MAKLLGRMGQRLAKGASEARERSKEWLGMAKLSRRINELEDEIIGIKEEIGEQFYQSYLNGTEPTDLPTWCEQITSLRKELTERRLDLDRVKGTIHCQQCGLMLEKASAFCPNCGSKLTIRQQ